MAAHTPGPWIARKGEQNDPDAHGVWGDVEAEYFAVASVWADIEDLKPHAEANARLIAAAPDLLAALQRIVDGETECGCAHDDEYCCALKTDFHCPFCIAAVAIAKAEGR